MNEFFIRNFFDLKFLVTAVGLELNCKKNY